MPVYGLVCSISLPRPMPLSSSLTLSVLVYVYVGRVYNTWLGTSSGLHVRPVGVHTVEINNLVNCLSLGSRISGTMLMYITEGAGE